MKRIFPFQHRVFRSACLSLGLILIGGGALDLHAQALDFASLPAAAQRAVRAQAGDAVIGDVDKDVEDGEVRFTVSFTKAGIERDVIVAEDGTLRSVEIPLEETAPAIRQAIKQALGDGKLESVARTFSEGKISYLVSWKNEAGAERTFTVESDGKVSSRQVGLEETPGPVRTTIEAMVSRLHAKLGDIVRDTDEDGTSYEVDVTANGVERDFSVLESGKLDSMQVFASDLPPAGKKTLSEKLGGGKLLRIDKEFEDGGSFVFHVEARKDGRPLKFMIGARGGFRGME